MNTFSNSNSDSNKHTYTGLQPEYGIYLGFYLRPLKV